MYYCNSRYYIPEWCRWLSADNVGYLDPVSVNGLNIFAFCYNNPISYVDPSGNSPKFWGQLASGIMIIGGAVCMFIPGGQVAGLALIGGGVGSLIGGEISEELGGDYLTGWVIGGVIGAIGGGYAATIPGVASFLSGSVALGGGGLSFVGAGTTGGSIAIATGAQIIGAGALASGMSIMFARIGKSGGYIVDHYYPNDHDPLHVHIRGDDISGNVIKVDIFGNPLKGEPPLPPGAKKAFWKLIIEIRKALLPWM